MSDSTAPEANTSKAKTSSADDKNFVDRPNPADTGRQYTNAPWFIYAAVIIFCYSFSLRLDWVICTDVAWLMTAAERFLNGGTYTTAFFEANPPLIILLEAIPVLLARLTGWGWDTAHLVFVYGLLGLSANMVWTLLKTMAPKDQTLSAMLVLSFVYATTMFLMDANFGQREHLIFIMMAPYILATTAVTYGVALSPKIRYASIIMGAIAALLKPYYILVPIALWLHRYIHTRRFFSGFDVEFTLPAAMAVAYLGVIMALFPDYLNVVLPDALDFYWGFRSPGWRKMVVFAFVPFALLMVPSALLTYMRHIRTTRAEDIASDALLVGGLVYLLIGVIQMKGFYYHALPAWFSGAILVALTGFVFGRHLRAEKEHYLRNLSMFLAAVIFLGAFPMRFYHFTIDEYRQTPFYRLVAEHAAGSSYALLSSELFPPFMIYMHDVTFSGRIFNIWPLHSYQAMLEEHDGEETERMTEIRTRMAQWMAEDIEKDKPAIVIVESAASERWPNPDEPLDIIALFSQTESFAEAWQPYEVLTEKYGHTIYKRATAKE